MTISVPQWWIHRTKTIEVRGVPRKDERLVLSVVDGIVRYDPRPSSNHFNIVPAVMPEDAEPQPLIRYEMEELPLSKFEKWAKGADLKPLEGAE